MFWLELKQKLENLAYRNLTRAMLSFLLIGEVFFISMFIVIWIQVLFSSPIKIFREWLWEVVVTMLNWPIAEKIPAHKDSKIMKHSLIR